MQPRAGNRKKQQVGYLIVFPLVVVGGFVIPKLLGCSDLLIVVSGFLSALVTIFAFYFAIHWRTPPPKPKDLPKPSWILRPALDSEVSVQWVEAQGFQLVARSIVEGKKHHWFFREGQFSEGLWRQDLELVEEKLCAHIIKFTSNDTMFGDDAWQFGTGHFLKPCIWDVTGPN